MDPLTTTAASGMRSRLESLDMIANNLANTGTAGFKADREYFNTYLSPDELVASPTIDSHWTDLSQGTIEQTGNSLDLSLSGPGFFTVQTPSGNLYTRNGNFRLNPTGEVVTSEGHRVLNDESKPIQADLVRPVRVEPDGTVWQGADRLGRIQVVSSPGAEAMSKRGSAYFSWTPQANAARPQSTQIVQGSLERSNAGTVDSAVRMVSVMRQFEALQRAVQLGGEMNKRAVEEVARVNS